MKILILSDEVAVTAHAADILAGHLAIKSDMVLGLATGDPDFVLILTAKSMQHYKDFTQRFFFENPNIKRFQTAVVMDRVKLGLSVPIDLEDDE